MLARKDRCKILADLGLDHILTSLPSCDPEINDLIMGKKGSFNKIMEGITNAVEAGIRVSVNMVLNESTVDKVYETAQLVHTMGCQKLFVTRMVPPTYIEDKSKMLLSPELTKKGLDQAIKAKNDFGIMIGSLVSYPLCFLQDLEKYKDFVGRGCPGQSGHIASINADGNVHACTHEAVSHGNVFDNSLETIYQSDGWKEWRSDLHYEGCKGCKYIDVCESGCRMSSLGINGTLKGKDPLFVGPHAFEKHFDTKQDTMNKKVWENIDDRIFIVPSRVRNRKEKDFYLFNARWGNTMPVDLKLAQKLLQKQKDKTVFSINDIGEEYLENIKDLFYKDFITISDEANISYNFNQDKMAGLSINLDALK